MDEVEHVTAGEDLVTMAEQSTLGFADLMDLPGPVHQGDHVGARPDHGVEEAVPSGQGPLRASAFGRVRGDPTDREGCAGLVANEEVGSP